MHESHIAQGIVRASIRAAGEQGGTKLVAAYVKLGKLKGIEPESLRLHFEVAARGTAAEGARLDIEETTGRGKCRECGEEFEVDSLPCACPQCNGLSVQVSGGDELLVDAIEVE